MVCATAVKPVRRFLPILAALFALLFVVAANRCLIAAAFPAEAVGCCEEQGAPLDSERELPCGTEGCEPCVTLESGVNLGALVPLNVPAPVWEEDCEWAALITRLAVLAADETPATPDDPDPVRSRPWHEVMKKATPVRGPSLAA